MFCKHAVSDQEDKQAKRFRRMDRMDQQLIDSAIKQCHKRLTLACVSMLARWHAHSLRQNTKLIKSWS